MFKGEVAKLKIKKSNLIEVLLLTPRLRGDDKRECYAAGVSPLRALWEGFRYSYICKTVYAGKKVIGMFGACSKKLPKDYCSIWFLGADESEKYPISFVKEGKKLIKEVLKDYKIICNAVYTGNESHIRYLERIGLIVDKDNKFKGAKGDFFPFYTKEE